jgi:hypothetical protein
MKNQQRKTTSMGIALCLLSLLALLSVSAKPTLAQCAVLDRTFSVPESTRIPVNTGVFVNRGDTVLLTASGTIWAGVVATGQNGPEGWADLRTAGTEFPLPGARIYSLLGRIGGATAAPFYIGQGTLFSANSSGQLFLQTNDNDPGNGNGAFSGRVQVFRPSPSFEERNISVPKSARSVLTGITVNNGDQVISEASSRIWSGVVFTGDTGPDGWEDAAPAGFPLPGAAKFSLLGRIGGSMPFYAGQFSEMRHTGASGPLTLLINDDVPANGGGQFICRIRVRRMGTPLRTTFTGTATLTDDNKNTPDPFVETIKTLPIVFSSDRCAISLAGFPTIVQTFPVSPGVKNTATITLLNGGSGSFDQASGRINIPITLRLTNSHPFGGTSDLSLTLTTEAVGGRRLMNGSLTLVGMGRFVGGFLGGTNATLTVTGAIDPMP